MIISQQAEVPFKVEKNETHDSWYISENPDEPEYLIIRSPFDSKETAIKWEMEFAEYWGYKAILLPS